MVNLLFIRLPTEEKLISRVQQHLHFKWKYTDILIFEEIKYFANAENLLLVLLLVLLLLVVLLLVVVVVLLLLFVVDGVLWNQTDKRIISRANSMQGLLLMLLLLLLCQSSFHLKRKKSVNMTPV